MEITSEDQASEPIQAEPPIYHTISGGPETLVEIRHNNLIAGVPVIVNTPEINITNVGISDHQVENLNESFFDRNIIGFVLFFLILFGPAIGTNYSQSIYNAIPDFVPLILRALLVFPVINFGLTITFLLLILNYNNRRKQIITTLAKLFLSLLMVVIVLNLYYYLSFS